MNLGNRTKASTDMVWETAVASRGVSGDGKRWIHRGPLPTYVTSEI